MRLGVGSPGYMGLTRQGQGPPLNDSVQIRSINLQVGIQFRIKDLGLLFLRARGTSPKWVEVINFSARSKYFPKT